jgi:hypothetical protein
MTFQHPLTDEMIRSFADESLHMPGYEDDMRTAYSMGSNAVFTALWVANAKRDPATGDSIGIGERLVYFKEDRWYTAIMKCKPHEVSPTFYPHCTPYCIPNGGRRTTDE